MAYNYINRRKYELSTSTYNGVWNDKTQDAQLQEDVHAATPEKSASARTRCFIPKQSHAVKGYPCRLVFVSEGSRIRRPYRVNETIDGTVTERLAPA